MNINMSIPGEREENEENNIQKIPKPITLNRPSSGRFRGNFETTKNIVKRQYPDNDTVRRNLVNYRNIKIRGLLIEYLNNKNSKRNLMKNIEDLKFFNLVTLKKNYVMLFGDLMQVIAVVFFLVSVIKKDPIFFFFSLFFNDFFTLLLLVFRIKGCNRIENRRSVEDGSPIGFRAFGNSDVFEYMFTVSDILLVITIIIRDVNLSPF